VAARRGELAEAERVGDRLTAAIAADTLAGALYAEGDPGGAAAVLERALAALGDNPETADRRLSMLVNRAGMLESLDRVPEADLAYRELLTASERIATPHRLAVNRIGAVEFYFQTGRWAEAATVLETLAEDRLPVPPLFKPIMNGVAALLAAHRDDEAEAREHLAADVPVGGGAAPVYSQYPMMARAVLAERDGEPERALAILAANLDSGAVAEMPARRLWLPMLARLALAVGDAATAAAAADVVAADEDAAGGSIPSLTAAGEHCRGLLDADPAPMLAAADRYRSVCRPVELAIVLEDAAVLLAEHGDAPAAGAAYAEAIEQYTALGAEWDLRRADTRLRPYGLRRRRARRRRPATGWDALTPTELTVAHLVADGLSNPDIATRQLVSHRTVDVHVSHILAKLGVRSRVDIAREAIRQESAVAR
jgi:DNA-binding CsgD family transcriptional regulator